MSGTFILSTRLSTHVESAVDKIETSRSRAVSIAESGGKNRVDTGLNWCYGNGGHVPILCKDLWMTGNAVESMGGYEIVLRGQYRMLFGA